MSDTESSPSIPISVHHPPRFDINDEAQAREMLRYLEENGYAVVASVASPQQIERAKDEFWKFCTDISPELDRKDVKTWTRMNWPPNVKNGILNQFGFNHSDFAWNTRLLPGVKRAFQFVWDCEDLLVSFDAGNAFRPWKHDPSWATEGGWWHVDQNCLKGDHRRGKCCVQGLVTYLDATDETGGLCLIPKSHLYHDDVCARSPDSRLKVDFVQVKATDPVMSTGGILVCAKAGDLILWDSRTVHCNTPALTLPAYKSAFEAEKAASTQSTSHNQSASISATAGAGNHEPHSDTCEAAKPAAAPPHTAICEGRHSVSPAAGAVAAGAAAAAAAAGGGAEEAAPDVIRLVAYVCMIPRSRVSAEVLRKRKEGFVQRAPTSHWPDQPPPRLPGEPARDPWACPREMLDLVGYTAWDRVMASCSVQ